MKDWNAELHQRQTQSGRKLTPRNDRLFHQYHQQAKLFRFLKEANVNVCLRHGFLLGAVRHRGYIEFGGKSYGTGYDNDPDVWALHEDRYRLEEALQDSSYSFVPYITFREYCARHSDDNHLQHYINRASFDVDDSFGFNIYEGNQLLLDGSYLYREAEEVFAVFCWSRISQIIKDEYGRARAYGEYRFALSDFTPLEYLPFYDDKFPVPRNYAYVLKEFYGDDVLKVIFSKRDDIEGGTIGERYAVTDNQAPPVNIYARPSKMWRTLMGLPGVKHLEPYAKKFWWKTSKFFRRSQ